jgi:hypothetical protein
MGKYYLGSQSGTQVNFSVADATGVVSDLNLSGLYLSVTGRAADSAALGGTGADYYRNAGNLTGYIFVDTTGITNDITGLLDLPNNYLSITGKAADSNLLDGYDSSYFRDGSNITGNVVLSGVFTGLFSGAVSHTDYVDFHTGTTFGSVPSRLKWNESDGTIDVGLKGGNVVLQIGQDSVSYVSNAEATTLNKGEVVYLFGAHGDRASVKRASNSTEATSSKTLGVVLESIAPNAVGFVMSNGVVEGLALGSYQAGDAVWLGSTPGTFTATRALAPSHLVFIGVVARANNGNGQLYVKVQNGFELNEIHDVKITGLANNDFLIYNSGSGLWGNKQADASIIVNAPYNGISSTNVQAAINELEAEKLSITGKAVDSDLLDGNDSTYYRNAANEDCS